VQLEGLKAPPSGVENATLPLGVLRVPKESSLTVAVQVVGLPTVVVAGRQLTSVVLAREVGVRSVVPAEPS
jgi:hypothetical protein